MKNEVMHFTDAPEIQHFAEVKVGPNDNVYGVTWANLVREYLKTAYAADQPDAKIVSYGITYQVLKRKEVTVFYDEAGNTLFDVENKRLEKEYAWVMNDDAPEDDVEVGEPETPMGKAIAGIERQAFENATAGDDEQDPDEETDMVPMGTASLADIATGNISEPTEEEVETAQKANAGDVSAQAKQKLEEELKKAKDKTFADPVIKYLLERCAEDTGLAEDVLLEHKTWPKCLEYIFSQARKQAGKERQCAVRNDVVFEWAEDYYHRDDKKEAEAEKARAAKKENDTKKKAADPKEKTAQLLKKNNKRSRKPEPKSEEKKPDTNAEVKKQEKKPAPPKAKEVEGQMSMFDFM
jgi:hypothetical protein